jgi:hypothetical protein
MLSELKFNVKNIDFIIITQVVLIPLIFGISLFTSAAAYVVTHEKTPLYDYPVKTGSVGPNSRDYTEMDTNISTYPHNPCPKAATSQIQHALPTITISGPSRYDVLSTSKLVTIPYSVTWQNLHIPKGFLPKISWIGGSFISNPTSQLTNITFDVVGMNPGSNATLPITVQVTDADGYSANATLTLLVHKFT